MSEDSCTDKKIWSSNPLENFGGHVTVRPHHGVAGNFTLFSVGACTLILHIHVVVS